MSHRHPRGRPILTPEEYQSGRDANGLSALPKPEGFVFASGVELTDGKRVVEGYYRDDSETVIASVSLEKLLQVICFYIAAQERTPLGSSWS